MIGTLRKRKDHAGVTLIELMVAELLMVIVGVALVVLYGQSYTVFHRGMTQTYEQEVAREAVRRIVPKITSAVPPPAPLSASGVSLTAYQPDAIVYPAKGDPTPSTELILYSTDDYVATVTKAPTIPVFDPRGITKPLVDEYSRYRIFFQIDSSKDQHDPKVAPGGQIGNVMIDPDTPGDTSDDIILARNVYDVTFTRIPQPGSGSGGGGSTTNIGGAGTSSAQTDPEAVTLQVDVYGYEDVATHQKMLHRVDYSTRVHLPFYTTFPGGG